MKNFSKLCLGRDNANPIQKSPIKEALIDIGVEQPLQLSIERLEAIHDRVKEIYPNRTNTFHVDARFSAGEEGDNRNTYNSEPPNETARTITSTILNLLENEFLLPSRLAPLADGGIALSFLENKNRAIIEVYNTGEIAAATYSDSNDPIVWEVENTDPTITAAIHKIRVRLTE